VFKLEFGPKAFIVVSDPVVVRHLLKDNAFNYDKGEARRQGRCSRGALTACWGLRRPARGRHRPRRPRLPPLHH
jgi:hypothetical protein